MALHGKVALVTGCAQGIGKGIAVRLARDGADIALVDLKADKLPAVAREIEALGRKTAVFAADVGDRDQVHAAVDHAEAELGGFDIMVNNAGIAQVNPLAQITPEEIELIFRVNVHGVLWGIQAAAAKFIARKHTGKIINACSIAGHEGFATIGAYSATKFAVRSLTQSAAREYAAAGITVNAYCPGIVDTPMYEEIDKGHQRVSGTAPGEHFKRRCASIALGRAETPEDVANLVSYLSGPDSDYITGQSIIIDGGMVYR